VVIRGSLVFGGHWNGGREFTNKRPEDTPNRDLSRHGMGLRVYYGCNDRRDVTDCI